MIIGQCIDLNKKEDQETFLSIISKAFTVDNSPKEKEIMIKGELVHSRKYESAPGLVLSSFFEIRDGNNELIIDDDKTIFINTPNESYEFVLLNEIKPEYSDPVLKLRYSNKKSDVKCYDLNYQEDLNEVLELLKETGFDASYDRIYKKLWIRGELVLTQMHDNPEIDIRKDNIKIIVRDLVKMTELRVIKSRPEGEPGSEVQILYLYPNIKVWYLKPFLEIKINDRLEMTKLSLK